MRIIVLFNLKLDIAVADYEEWALSRDIPGVRSLPSVDDFTLYRTTGLLGGGAAPYQYVEVLDIADMKGFFTDTGNTTSQAIAEELKQWIDGPPLYITTEEVLRV